jgi:hypothetical protein
MPKTTFKEDGTRSKFVLYYNDIRSINWFLKTPLEADDEGERERRTKSIPGHQRRKGPSDQNPINVKQSNADYMFDPTLKSGNALPGRSIILKTTKDADIEATRQFTLVGRALDFQEYFEDQFKYATYCYFSEGGRHEFKPTIGGGE